jgi:hypothetical protein
MNKIANRATLTSASSARAVLLHDGNQCPDSGDKGQQLDTCANRLPTLEALKNLGEFQFIFDLPLGWLPGSKRPVDTSRPQGQQKVPYGEHCSHANGEHRVLGEPKAVQPQKLAATLNIGPTMPSGISQKRPFAMCEA